MATGWWFNIDVDEEVSELAWPVVSNTDFNLFNRNGKSIKIASASVKVSSSDLVAEIIGKQGCKIKELRAKTNTFIRTPLSGENPVFLISGRNGEDVSRAKYEIEEIAKHFMLIRGAIKEEPLHSLLQPVMRLASPGDIAIKVNIPQQFVGLVVGYKGETIRYIQSHSDTKIVTPMRNEAPIFEIFGSPANVEKAKHYIESYIDSRTKINREPSGDAFGFFNQLSSETSQIFKDVTNLNDNYRYLDEIVWNSNTMNLVDTIPATLINNKAVGAEMNLIRRSKCSFCKVNEVKATILPCRHALSCIVCANNVTTAFNNLTCVVCNQNFGSGFMIFKN